MNKIEIRNRGVDMVVIRRSENTNAFGLRGYWVYDAKTLEVHSFAANHLFTTAIGRRVTNWDLQGVELWQHELTVPSNKRAQFEKDFNINTKATT